MKIFRFTLIAMGALTSILAVSCGSGGGSVSPPPPPQISVAISPGAQNVQTGAKLQFAATVTGTANTAVSWKAGGIAGGNAAVGTISASGLYTAPASVPNPNTVSITATSQADSTTSASVVLTIVPPPIKVSVSPASANVVTRYSQQFTATVTGTSNSSVVWQVNGVTGGNDNVGTIDGSGLYTAPVTVPSPSGVTVSSTSVADSTKSASAVVTVLAPPAPTGTWSYLGPSGASFAEVSIVPDHHDPNVLYASAAYRGIYKSTDQGKSWQLIFDNVKNGVGGTVFDPLYIGSTSSTLYLFTVDQKLRISTDGGKSFSSQPYPTGMTVAGGYYPPLAIDPNSDENIYLLGSNGIFKSTDTGATWVQLSLPPGTMIPGSHAQSYSPLAIVNSNPATIVVGVANGVEISGDGGSTWIQQNAGLDANFLKVTGIVQDFANPQRLLLEAGYTGTGFPDPNLTFYESVDAGKTWKDLGEPGLRLADVQTGPNILATGGGLYRSSDDGKSWQDIADSSDSSASRAAMIPNAPNTLFYAGLSILHRSTNDGKTWSVSDRSIQARDITHVEVGSPASVYASDVDGGLWISADSGTTWNHVVTPYTKTSSGTPATNVVLDTFAVNPADAQQIVGLSMTEGMGFLSGDGGATWSSVPLVPEMDPGGLIGITYSIKFGTPSSKAAYACGSYGVARFDLTARSWHVANSGLGDSPWCLGIAADQNLSGTLYASLFDGQFAKSVDGGAHWTELATPRAFTTVTINPKNSSEIYGGAAFNSMKSNDGGKTWSGLTTEGDLYLDTAHPTTVYSHTTRSVGISYDSGFTWAQIPNKPSSFDTDMAIVPGTGAIFAASLNAGIVTFKVQ